MAHVIVKSDGQKNDMQTILKQFGGANSAEHREFAECIAARTREAQQIMRKGEK